MATEQDFGETFAIYQDPCALPQADPAFEPSLDEVGNEYPLDETHEFEGTNDTVLESVETDNDEHAGHRYSSLSNRGSIRSWNHRGMSGDEAVFDEESYRSSPTTTSRLSCNELDDAISEIPDAQNVPDEPRLPSTKRISSPYTPMKQRSPFRKTSSVRALQMETTPPPPTPAPVTHSPYVSSPRSQNFKISTPSRNGTPRSQGKKLGTAKKKEYPLVLLHVTLLPIAMPYSVELMEAVLPGYILENYNLLRDKINDTVLERGILLPHPREDYDLLEERLLESLELKLPRILKCGHFHISEEEQAEIDGDDAYDDVDDEDLDICEDCGRRIRDGKSGSGSGNRRWNIKIFAANGLMRAGAWTAAWREMERVDVEVGPWIPEELKRELEARKEMQEEEDAEHRVAAAAAAAAEAAQNAAERSETTHRDYHRDEPSHNQARQSAEADQLRLREIYGDLMPGSYGVEETSHVEHDGDDTAPVPRSCEPQRARNRRSPTHHSSKRTIHRSLDSEIPLTILIRNYLLLLARDRRNVAIALLSILVVFLSLNTTNSGSASSSTTNLDSSARSSDIPNPWPTSILPTLTSAGATASTDAAKDADPAPFTPEPRHEQQEADARDSPAQNEIHEEPQESIGRVQSQQRSSGDEEGDESDLFLGFED
ncbi:MAG: hypothetical protein M1837_005350 [Sclerophora amabilis]|nr:MAG: hypothetical protein M1837_005350 [Sclerophora amabilis]